jgi:hypothetical protein
MTDPTIFKWMTQFLVLTVGGLPRLPRSARRCGARPCWRADPRPWTSRSASWPEPKSQQHRGIKPAEQERTDKQNEGRAKAYRNLPMVVSWEGRVSFIGFRGGVAIGSPAEAAGAAAGSLAGARGRREEKEGRAGAGVLLVVSCSGWHHLVQCLFSLLLMPLLLWISAFSLHKFCRFLSNLKGWDCWCPARVRLVNGFEKTCAHVGTQKRSEMWNCGQVFGEN